ncbi:bromodomain and WD repeat-containing protein 3-like isoform X2 [Dreissena polymorpha]|uniref:bromodomain and WD repeat-containing protein 3-like isoform X2 n=1 Tax=Dreissena polymorpha TaxID=45954 RepID=UPI002263D5AF|nr:bromodomain and WD repeat-containing protein 3-like isoform X2 [Dreissena polymorpha]
MSGCIVAKKNTSPIEWELYFLIERFLSSGPCKSAGNVLRRELIERGLLPKRIDWNGGEHERSYESLLEINRHIGGDHLLRICQRLGPLLDEKIKPHILGIGSLLGAGTQSLLRTEQDITQTEWPPSTHVTLQHGRPKYPPHNMVVPNWLYVQRGMEMSGQSQYQHVVPTCMYACMRRLSRKLGHLSAVYCVLFDRTGEFLFTGADDSLVKVWWVTDSRLKATLRGHGAEITDMAINFENTLLASGSCDRTIRVWCLKSKAPAAILQGHTGMITSVQFSPMVHGTRRYLASTGGDACVCFWEWNTEDNSFNVRPVKYVEKSRAGAQVLCSSFSPGGMFFAAGSTDNVIRMYHFHAGYPEKIGELEKHTDRVDSICYANNDARFLSGSKDGTARIWKFERNEWRNIVLDMNVKLPKKPSEEDDEKKRKARTRNHDNGTAMLQKLRVTMVGWNSDDNLVITAVNDHLIKIWCSYTGQLIHELRGHDDEVFVLEACDSDPRILLSAGHDGNIIIWDIIKGIQVKQFFNQIEGQGHGAVFDCKLSKDGCSFIATDSHGHLMVYGHSGSEKYSKIPHDVFFHTDYRPLMRDSNHYVLDEQTQQAPHLMPPPFLVDLDGNPYPPALQRLVPGREACKEEQLIPEFHVNEEGEQEVAGDRVIEQPVEDPPAAAPNAIVNVPEPDPVSGEIQPGIRPSIDEMIEQLQREQDQRLASQGQAPIGSPPHPGPLPQLGSPRPRPGPSRSISVAGPSTGGSHMVGMRRVGETEGVRQSLGNILQVSTSKDLAAIRRRIVVRDLDREVLRKSENIRIALAEQEIRNYNMERRKKNLVLKHESSEESEDFGIQTRKKKKTTKHSYTTRANADEDAATNRLTQRALYDTEDEEIEEGALSDKWEEDMLDDPDDSSDYSDWCMDTGPNLQPPKRRSTRMRKRKRFTSSEPDTDEEEDESEDTIISETQTTSQEGSQVSRREGSLSRGREESQPRGKAVKKTEAPRRAVGKKKRGPKRKQTAQEAAMLPGKTPEQIQELVTRFRPSDWLTDVIPRKQPYFPQMGDEVIYFRQGHELYVKAVERRKIYPIDVNKGQAWHKSPSLREQELARIVGIRYEVLKCGVRLCCLKLNFIDPVTLKNTGGSFNIKYHDMTDVVDFLVLKQNYDTAMDRKWAAGCRFRSIIDDSWWMGIIEEQIPFQEEYPDSLFQCFKVRWDSTDKEFLSPWDLEPVDERRSLDLVPGSIHDLIGKFIESCCKLFNHHKQDYSFISDLYKHAKDPDNFALFHIASDRRPSKSQAQLAAFFRQETAKYQVHVTHQTDDECKQFDNRAECPYTDLVPLETEAELLSEKRRSYARSRRKDQSYQVKRVTRSNAKGQKQTPCKSAKTSTSQFRNHPLSVCHLHKVKARPRLYNLNTKLKYEPCPPSVIGGGVLVTPSELKSLMYKPRPSEWPGGPMDQECDRIVQAWEQVMGHSIAEPFLTPVDLNAFPSYAVTIEYPMDLNTIKRRLENRFYRRVTSLQFDLRYIESNAKKFNEPKSQIVKSAQILCDALLKFISDVDSPDPCQLINSLVHGRKIHWSSGSGDETEEYDTPGTSQGKHSQDDAGPGTSGVSRRRRVSGLGLDPDGWRRECRQLLETITQCEDSEPFRHAVSIDDYPDYYAVIENPMDLGIVREKLDSGEYSEPTQLARDMSLIFSNSKLYNTNKRSRIYTMTLRLSAMFDSRIKELIETWRKAVKRSGRKYQPHQTNSATGSGLSHSRQSRGSHAIGGYSALANGISHSDDDDSDVNVIAHSPEKGARTNGSRKRPMRVRRAVRRHADYRFSDGENPDFPDPKPDYTDDDFEVEPKRNSPKKKGARKRLTSDQGADETSQSGYSTRARTGTIKMKKYTNEGFMSDEEDEDNESVISDRAKHSRSQKPTCSNKQAVTIAQESSGSDTEIEDVRTAVTSKQFSQSGREDIDDVEDDDEEDSESVESSESEESDSKPVARKGRPGRKKGKQAKGRYVKNKKKVAQNGQKGGRGGRTARDYKNSESEQSDIEQTQSDSEISIVSEEGWESDSDPHETVPRTRGSKVPPQRRVSSEDSENSDSGPPRKRSRVKPSSANYASKNGSRGGGRSTRNQGKQTVKYNEESGNSDSDAGTTSAVTVSSRGRLRKPTARARAMLY